MVDTKSESWRSDPTVSLAQTCGVSVLAWLVSYLKQSLLWSVVIEVSLVLYCLFMKCNYNTLCIERAGGRYCLFENISWFLGFYHTFNMISFPSCLQRAFRCTHTDSCSSLLLQPVVWDGSTVGHQLGTGKQLAEPGVKAIWWVTWGMSWPVSASAIKQR